MRDKQVELRLVCHDHVVSAWTMRLDTDPADPIISINRRGWGEQRSLDGRGVVTKYEWTCPECGISRQTSLPRMRALLWGMVENFQRTGSDRLVVLPLERVDAVLASVRVS